VWLARVSDTVRRVADRAGHAAQAAQAAVPEVVSTASHTVMSAAGAGGGFGERVIAAGMTLIVAGGVTVGAATIVKDRADPDRGVRAEAPVVAPAPAPEPTELVNPKPRPSFDDVAPKEAQGPPEILDEPVVTEPSAEEEAEAEEETTAPVAESPSPEPTEEPSPEPTEEPSPSPTVPPPAPAWTGAFGIGWQSEDLCGCGSALTQAAWSVTGGLLTPEGAVHIVQTLRGPATDAEGDAAWAVSAQVTADLRQAGGDVLVSFTLQRRGVKTRFSATGFATEISGDLRAGEPVSYTFGGTYTIVGAGLEESPIRTSGSLSARIVVWTDGATPVVTQISLIP
jgi:hypothetical protein